MEDQNIPTFQNAQQGSGSAENRGRDRSEQKSRGMDLSADEKQNVARGAGVGKKDIADLGDLGEASGRDDYAGGFAEGMGDESTNERTEQ